MKKKAILAIGAALLLAASACLAGCGARAGKLYDAKEKEPVVAVQEITGMPAGYDLNSVSRWGTARFRKADTAIEGGMAEMLYNAETGKWTEVSGTTSLVSGDMRYISTANEAGQYDYTVYCGGEAFSSGTSAQRLTVRGGVLYTDKNVFYCTPDGTPVQAESLSAPVLTANCVRCGDVYYDMEDEMIYTFKKDGEFRAAEPVQKIVPDRNSEEVASWEVDGKLFLQYSAAVPDDSAKYTYYDDTARSKMKLVTRSYDLSSGKVKSYDDFGYVAEDLLSAEDDYVVLAVRRVTEDKLLSDYANLQTFGKDGKVYVDLQKLLPGAEGLVIHDGYVFLSAGDVTKVYKGSSLRGTVYAVSGMSYSGSGTFAKGSRQYSPEGELVRTLADGAEVLWTNGKGTTYYTLEADTGEVKLCSVDASGVTLERGTSPIEYADGKLLCMNAAAGYSLIDIFSDTAIFENIALTAPSVAIRSAENEDRGKGYSFVVGTTAAGTRTWLVTETAQ